MPELNPNNASPRLDEDALVEHAAPPEETRAPQQTPFWKGVRGDVAILTRGCDSRLKSLALVLSNRGFKALLLYRLANACWRSRLTPLSMVFSRIAQVLYVVDISYKARIGPGVTLVHGFGIVIGSNARIEGDCSIFHGVTLGDRGSEWTQSDEPDGHPTIKRTVILGAGAKILGPITVGPNAAIGANAVVARDAPPNSVTAGIPGRVIAERPQLTNALRPLDDRYFE